MSDSIHTKHLDFIICVTSGTTFGARGDGSRVLRWFSNWLLLTSAGVSPNHRAPSIHSEVICKGARLSPVSVIQAFPRAEVGGINSTRGDSVSQVKRVYITVT